MAMLAKHAARPGIVRDPRVLGGEPTISGTRVPVRSVVLLYRLYQNLQRVQQAFPMLDSLAIEKALAFYAANRDEVDRYIAENESEEV